MDPRNVLLDCITTGLKLSQYEKERKGPWSPSQHTSQVDILKKEVWLRTRVQHWMWILTSLGPGTENYSKVYIFLSSLSLSPIITLRKSPSSGRINLYVLDFGKAGP